MMTPTKMLALALMGALSVQTTMADDWRVNRLRGIAEQYDGQQWHALSRGDVVQNSRHVRTHHGARMELVRRNEVIELEPATFLVIHEANGRKMTTVDQSLGSVIVQAEKRDVQHFEVRTPMLAAVVKGTQFTVTIDNGRTGVDVDRGMVEVADEKNDISANVMPGQSAVSNESGGFQVSGPDSGATIYIVGGVPIPANQLQQTTG